jgi:hypothetical protein
MLKHLQIFQKQLSKKQKETLNSKENESKNQNKTKILRSHVGR